MKLVEINALIEQNVRRLLWKRDSPIGNLLPDYNVVVLGRNRVAKRALVIGLGVMGVGLMWVDEDQAARQPGFEGAIECSEI